MIFIYQITTSAILKDNMGFKLRGTTKVFMVVALLFVIAITLTVLSTRGNLLILFPTGSIGRQQRDLLKIAFYLSLFVVVPVYIMLATFAWKYRSTKNNSYHPNWDSDSRLEAIWWGVPIILIGILSFITWKSSHNLDPFRPITNGIKPVRIQVVALQWRWLFIYPEQQIASINFLQIPDNTPIEFEITADAPMNSFWIPSLGGQVYAMNGMTTKLHLLGTQVGNYQGSSANISGQGFSNMRFEVKVSTPAEFSEWVSESKQATNELSIQNYGHYSAQTSHAGKIIFSNVETGLKKHIVDKYLKPVGQYASNKSHVGSNGGH